MSRALAFLFSCVFFLLARGTAFAAAKPVTLTVEGRKVAALCWQPAAAKQAKAPAVILMHMLGHAKEDWTGFGDFLEKNGIAAMAMDLRGGAGAGREKLLADARAAYEYLMTQPGVDAQRIGVIGASIGANGALQFAVAERRVKCAVLLSPGLDFHGVTTEAAMEKMKRPVMLVASEDDDYSAESVKKLEKLHPGPKTVKIYAKAGHGTDIFKAGVGLESEILGFLKAHL